MKIIFMGTPGFSAAVLEKLNSVYPVTAAITGTDKPAGRGYSLQPSALKLKAQELDIPLLQFDKVSKEGINAIKELEPDVVITAAFGQILSEDFLAVPKYGVLNVHASLLPLYRGASPIQWSIINGDKQTGITIMRTVKAVDAGDVLLQKAITVGDKETAGELFERLSSLGGDAIVEALSLLESGRAVFTPQDESKATHCGMISKNDGNIDFSKTARQLDCFVRGMTPWPTAFTSLNGKKLKVFSLSQTLSDVAADCGTVLVADEKQGLIVACKDGAVRLETVQLEGSRKMTAKEFLRGRKISTGTLLQ